MKTTLVNVECDLTSGTTKDGKPWKRLNILDRTACERIGVFAPDDLTVDASKKYDVTVNLSASGKFYFDSIAEHSGK